MNSISRRLARKVYKWAKSNGVTISDKDASGSYEWPGGISKGANALFADHPSVNSEFLRRFCDETGVKVKWVSKGGYSPRTGSYGIYDLSDE